MHVSHHHLKRATRAQPTPPPAPPLIPNANIGDPTPPPHHRTRTPVERRNGSPGKQAHPLENHPVRHIPYPVSRATSWPNASTGEPTLPRKPLIGRLTHCPQPSPASIARHVPSIVDTWGGGEDRDACSLLTTRCNVELHHGTLDGGESRWACSAVDVGVVEPRR